MALFKFEVVIQQAFCCRFPATPHCWCRLLALGIGSFVPGRPSTSVPHQSCDGFWELLSSPNRLSLLYPVRWQQKAHMQTLRSNDFLQPQDTELRVASGRCLRAQRHNESREPASTDMRTGQVWNREQEGGLFRLHAFFRVQRNVWREKTMSEWSTF